MQIIQFLKNSNYSKTTNKKQYKIIENNNNIYIQKWITGVGAGDGFGVGLFLWKNKKFNFSQKVFK